jgi:tetratricopeptide (TPR) repeat protein
VARLQLKLELTQKSKQDFGGYEASEKDTTAEMDRLLNQQIERHAAAVVENPNHANLHYRLAVLLRGKGQTERAIQHLQQAVQINGSYFKGRIKLALALREIGRGEEAATQITEALCLSNDSVALHYRLGLMYCDKLHFSLAVEQYALSLGEGLAVAEVEANLNLALQNMGLVDRAAAAWQGVCELEPNSVMAFQAQRGLTTLKALR